MITFWANLNDAVASQSNVVVSGVQATFALGTPTITGGLVVSPTGVESTFYVGQVKVNAVDLIWSIDETEQTPGWSADSATQTPAWATVATTQTPGWGAISSTQLPGWSNIIDVQAPAWSPVTTS